MLAPFPIFQIILVLLCLEGGNASYVEIQQEWPKHERIDQKISSHSCIHDQILEQRRRPVYLTPQVYQESSIAKPLYRKGRALLGLSVSSRLQKDAKQPIRIYLNYDAVGHSPDRDCRNVGDVVKVGYLSVF